ncbi:DUF1194 domain-containing protein [Yoonia sp. 208BN28-4]|uniref:DUF1194 domain-containing protein n=1 Tax=Yoonia sp. 208BN28-4 TaxID=3126505 RepID=UPI003097256A
MIRFFAIISACFASTADAACRQALALGLDVSGSVDATEYRLQLDGLATALESEAVQQVLFAQSAAPVDIAVYEWSGPTYQRLVLDWQTLLTPDDLAAATTVLRSTNRVTADLTTAIGSAMIFGFDLLDQRQNCWKRTLDISGDGEANTGPRPQDIPDSRTPAGVVVNGLVIATSAGSHDRRQAEIKELSSYFAARVIRGPDAFVEAALGFTDYAAAMERKLLRELTSLALSDATPPDQ